MTTGSQLRIDDEITLRGKRETVHAVHPYDVDRHLLQVHCVSGVAFVVAALGPVNRIRRATPRGR